MANAKKTFSPSIAALRQQVADAVLQGFLDSVLSSDLSTAKTNGYQPGRFDDSDVVIAPIAGINR